MFLKTVGQVVRNAGRKDNKILLLVVVIST